LDSKNENAPREKPWQERVWVVAVAGQAGIYIAFPVLLGMVVGFFIDRQFGTYILFFSFIIDGGIRGRNFPCLSLGKNICPTTS